MGKKTNRGSSDVISGVYALGIQRSFRVTCQGEAEAVLQNGVNYTQGSKPIFSFLVIIARGCCDRDRLAV
jgi:hypothetical protein